MTDVIGRGVIEVVTDGTKASAGISDVKTALQKLKDEAKNAGETLTSSSTNYLRALERQTAAVERQAATFGKSKSEIAALNASQLGVSSTASGMVARLREAEQALAAQKAAAKGAADAIRVASTATHGLSFETAAAKRELLVLAHELSQGNYKRFGGSIMVLGEQTGAASLLFSRLGLAALGATAIIGGFAAAAVKGAMESRALADAIVLSGNFAGKTEGSFNSLSKSVAASTHDTVGNVREFNEALIASGEIGPQVFTAAATAAAAYGRATGKTAQEVAKDFADMSRAPTKFAAEANRSLNFLTAAQFASIKGFEDSGRSIEAQGVIYEALNQRLTRLHGNLGDVDRILIAGKQLWSDWWEAAKGFGRAQTVEDELKSIETRLLAARDAASAAPGIGAADINAFSGKPTLGGRGSIAKLEEQQADARRRQFLQGEAAFADADRAATEKRRIAAFEAVEGYKKQAKGLELVNVELKKAKDNFAALKGTSLEVSAGDQARILADIRKRFAGPKNTEADQVRKAQLAGALKTLQDELQQERDAMAFHSRYLDGVYHASEISLKDYYDERKSLADQGLAAELATLAAERAKLEAFLAKTTDPSDRVQTQTKITENLAQAERARTRASEEAVLTDQQQAAATKALNDQVTAYRANLLQLAGDEAGAARVRAKVAIDNARLLSKQSGGAVSQADIAAQERLLEDTIKINKARDAGTNILDRLQLSEDRIALSQKSGALGEFAALRAIGEARKSVVDQLEAQVTAQEKVAATSPDEKIRIGAARARLELEKLKDSLDPLKEKFDNVFKDAGASAIESVLNGTRGIRGALSDFGKSVAGSINADISKELSGQLFGKGGIGGGAGGLLADLFGGKGGASAQTAAAGAIAAASTTSSTALAALTTSATAAATALSAIATTGGAGGAAGAFGLAGGIGGLFGAGFTPAAATGTDLAVQGLPFIPFAQGTNRVPRSGIYHLDKDEMVVPVRFNPALAPKTAQAGQGSGSSSGSTSNDRRPLNINVTMQPQRGMSRASAMQQGADAAFAMQRAMRNA